MEQIDETPYSVGVDRDMCQSAATCLAYQIYELDDESKAVLLTKNGLNSDDPSTPLASEDGYVKIDDLLNSQTNDLAEMRDLVLESAKACPFNAIIVKNAAGDVIWPIL